MTVRLTIGEFSKMTYLSVKALRHYHDVGLLEPAEIDPSSGYRHYGADQVATAQAIRRFRDLDMPIDRVRAVLGAPDEPSRNRAILEHLDAMQRELARTQQTVASLHALLSPAGATRPLSYRTLPAAVALARRGQVEFDAAGTFCDEAYAALHAALAEDGLVAGGPDAASYDDAFFEAGVGEVIAYVPFDAPVAPAVSDGLEALDIPALRVAVMVHEGSFDDLDQTYGALGTAVAELGLGAPGPIHELYLADDRTEVCWPITQGDPT